MSAIEDGTAAAGVRTGTAERPQRKRELQDSLNHYLYHPLAWRLAKLLARTPITPNMVSVIGAGFVVAAGIAYAQPPGSPLGWPVSALLGMVLHMTWHVVDGADGDLARMTGRSSPIGEMVDGVCDYASHVVLYLILGWLLSAQLGGVMAWSLAVIAGISHAVQSNHVEVQRRQYQWWFYGTSWIRHSHGEEGAATRQNIFGVFVSLYLAAAMGMTPYAKAIDDAAVAAEHDPALRDRLHAAVRAEARPLLQLLKFLGPNPRAIVLGLSMIFGGSPLYYFLYQAVFLNLLLVLSVVLHNRAAKRMAAAISA